MENISFLLLLRLSFTLLAGFWIVRRLRNLLRAIIVRLMPPKHRFSEHSFNMQTRISAVLSIVLAIGIAAALDYGIFKANEALNLFQKKQPNVMEYSSSTPAPKLPQSKEAKQKPTEPEIAEETTPPKDLPKQAEQMVPVGLQVYAQVEAFIHEENAWAERNSVQIKIDRTVLVAVVRKDLIPYKVVIGPFATRKAATDYLRQHRLQGFPRTASGLLFPAQ